MRFVYFAYFERFARHVLAPDIGPVIALVWALVDIGRVGLRGLCVQDNRPVLLAKRARQKHFLARHLPRFGPVRISDCL